MQAVLDSRQEQEQEQEREWEWEWKRAVVGEGEEDKDLSAEAEAEEEPAQEPVQEPGRVLELGLGLEPELELEPEFEPVGEQELEPASALKEALKREVVPLLALELVPEKVLGPDLDSGPVTVEELAEQAGPEPEPGLELEIEEHRGWVASSTETGNAG